MARKSFDGGTVATTLSGSINASVTSLSVANGDSYPSSTNPFVIAIDRNTANEEKLLIASRSGNTFTVSARGYDGTVAIAHADGATVEHVLDAITVDEANAIANAMTTNGDLLTYAAGAPARIAIGTTGYPLVSNGSSPAYAQVDTPGIADEAVTSAKIESGTIVNANINAAAAIADTKLATITTANKVNVSAIDLDGATDIGGALADTDLILVDDGAAGVNRKSALSRVATWLFAKVSGDITINSSGVSAIGNDKVTAAMIGAGQVAASELATDAVETVKIKDLNVTAAKLAANAVETAKINDGAVTNAKLNTTAGQLGGAWQTFTPVIATGTHTGAKVGRYLEVGKTVDFLIHLTFATGDNFSGLAVTLPVAPHANANISQFQVLFGNGPVPLVGLALVSGSNLLVYAVRANSTYADAVAISNTIPFSWVANDTVQISGRYEAA